MPRYRILHRASGEGAVIDAPNAQAACERLGWAPAACQVKLDPGGGAKGMVHPQERRRLARVCLLLRLLGQGWCFRYELAERLGVTERQVQRDLALLRGAGIEVTRARGRGYHLKHCPVCGHEL